MFQRALRIEYAHDLMLLEKCNQLSINIYRPYLQRLDQQSQLYVVGLIMENPALYLAEICQHIHEVFALNVTPSTVCRLLRSYALYYKGVIHFGEHLGHNVQTLVSMSLYGLTRLDLTLDLMLLLYHR